MSSESEPPMGGKKHRVIHWNPEAGREQNRRRWTVGRIVLWTAGGLVGLLAVAAVVTRTIKFVNPEAFAALSGNPAPVVQEDPSTAFITQANADAARVQAAKTLDQLRKLPNEHPRQQEDLILIEKEFNAGTTILKANRYAEALAHFRQLIIKMDEFGESVKAKQEAQTGLDALLARIREMEIARDLAPMPFDAANTEAGVASAYNRNGSFLLAKRAVEKAMGQLDEVEGALADYIAGNLQRGLQALARGEKDNAANAFRAALNKSPGNEAAVTGLRRSQNIERVHSLNLQGEQLEGSQRYAEAAEVYRRAFELDPLSAVAQQGQARALDLDQKTRFNTAFGAAQDAFGRRDWPVVITQAEAALKVQPNNNQVKEMIASAREEAHRDSIAKALAQADAFEKVYNWSEAHTAYQAAEKLEPKHADAVAGITRTGAMLRTLLEYNKYVDAAEKLAGEGDFQGAIANWNTASTKKPAYLALDERSEKLHRLLIEQNKEVVVTLQSDNKTTVSIIGAAAVAQTKFKTKTVALKPGNYEVVGNRRGYRDVRIAIKVRQGEPMPVVSVACTVSNRRI